MLKEIVELIHYKNYNLIIKLTTQPTKTSNYTFLIKGIIPIKFNKIHKTIIIYYISKAVRDYFNNFEHIKLHFSRTFHAFLYMKQYRIPN